MDEPTKEPIQLLLNLPVSEKPMPMGASKKAMTVFMANKRVFIPFTSPINSDTNGASYTYIRARQKNIMSLILRGIVGENVEVVNILIGEYITHYQVSLMTENFSQPRHVA